MGGMGEEENKRKRKQKKGNLRSIRIPAAVVGNEMGGQVSHMSHVAISTVHHDNAYLLRWHSCPFDVEVWLEDLRRVPQFVIRISDIDKTPPTRPFCHRHNLFYRPLHSYDPDYNDHRIETVAVTKSKRSVSSRTSGNGRDTRTYHKEVF